MRNDVMLHLSSLSARICLLGCLVGHGVVMAQLSLGGVSVPKEKIVTYIFIGHSNMAGRTNDPQSFRPTFHQTHPRCWNFNIVDDFTDPAVSSYHHQWIPAKAQIHRDMNSSSSQTQCGPAMAFLKEMATGFPDAYFGVTQNAESAASTWKYRNDTNRNNGPPLYSQIIAAATAIQPDATIGGVVMMLCLADGLRHPDTYKQNVKELIAMFRSDLNMPNLPVFISDYEYGSTGQRDPGTAGAQKAIQVNQQLPGEVDHCYLIPTKSWSNQQQYMHDDHHYNLKGYVRWAQELVTIITENDLGPAAVVDNQPPSPPTGLSATNVDANSVRITWNASNDNDAVEKYAIIIDGDSVATTGQTAYLAENAGQCRTYTFAIRAYDFAGNVSDASNALGYKSFCSSDTVPPSVPSGLQATDTTARAVTLVWNTSDDGAGITYRVYTDGSLDTSVADTTVRIAGLSPATSVDFFIRAVDSVGNVSLPGDTLTITTPNTLVGNFPLKINLGGTAYNEYVPDQAYSSDVAYGFVTQGQVTSTNNAIAGTDDDAIYRTIRYGDFDYRINVPSGTYTITLLMAESYAGKSVGARLFNVKVNSSLLTDQPVDIYDNVGADAAYTLSGEVEVSVTKIDIVFERTQASSYSPICSGIIVQQAAPYRITSPVPDTIDVYDTLEITWETNNGLVNGARLWISADAGLSWHEISPGLLSRLDASWEQFMWEVPPVIEEDTLKGKSCVLMISDYDVVNTTVANELFYVMPDYSTAQRQQTIPSAPVRIGSVPHRRAPSINLTASSPYKVALSTPSGKVVYRCSGTAPARITLPQQSLNAQKLYLLSIELGERRIVRKLPGVR
ncbi:MAG: hypothetical protein GF398_02220 [Chitinivibrionales bacterium]|nr:hypothetical protein [Chitinivibrionales bacterium]